MNAKELTTVFHAVTQMQKYTRFGLELMDAWVETDEWGTVSVHTRFSCKYPRRLAVIRRSAEQLGFACITYREYLEIVQ